MNQSLAELQSQEESERFDFKEFEAIENSKKFAKHLVGFANAYGGKIALGFKDSGELQGKEVDYDEVMQTITNIAYSRCSPQIKFDDEYRSTPKGDFLILEISPMDDIPYAVVEKSEGTITCRDYWIRTKNSTRRVSDVELDRLFSKGVDPDFTREFNVWAMISIDDHQLPGVNLPDSVDNYRTLFNGLDFGAEIEQDLALSRICQELYPFVLLEDLNKIHRSTWDTEIKNTKKPFQHTSLLGPNFPNIPATKDLEQNHDAPSYEVDKTDIHFAGFDETYISDFTEPFELLDNIEFQALPNTEYVIEYSIDERPDDDIAAFPNYEFKIRREGEFQITIENRGGSSGRGFPTDHPIMDVATDNKFRRIDLEDIQNKWEYSNIYNIFRAEFEFPESPDADIRLNERYANRFWHLIERRHSVDKFLEGLPNTEIYKINHKLDMIVESLFQE